MLKNCDPGIRGEIWSGRKGGRRELPAKPDGPYTLVADPHPHKYSRAHNYTNTHGHTIAQIDTYIHTHMRTNAKGDKLSQTIPYHLGCSFTPSEGGSSDAIFTKYNKYQKW